jgi:hypothetical protein
MFRCRARHTYTPKLALAWGANKKKGAEASDASLTTWTQDCRPANSNGSCFNVRVRTKSGHWQKVFDTYCGIVGGAALTPGVDVFGLPAEVGWAGYGVYRAVETIVEAL